MAPWVVRLYAKRRRGFGILRLLAAVIGILGDVRTSCVRTQDERAAPVYSFAASMCCSDTIILLAFAGPHAHTQRQRDRARGTARRTAPRTRTATPTPTPHGWPTRLACAGGDSSCPVPLPASTSTFQVHVFFVSYNNRIWFRPPPSVFGFVHRRDTRGRRVATARRVSRRAHSSDETPTLGERAERRGGSLQIRSGNVETRGRACR